MLALADHEGVVRAAVRGLAHQARVTDLECTEALAVLSSPDPDSRTADNEGRRIEALPGGWLILNHGAYRDMRTEDQAAAAARMRRLRAKRKAEPETSEHVRNNRTSGTGSEHPTDTEADVDTDAEPLPTGVGTGFALQPPPSPKRTRSKPKACTDAEWRVVADAYESCRVAARLARGWGPRDTASNRAHVARAIREGALPTEWGPVMLARARAILGGEDPKWASLEHVARHWERYRLAALAGPAQPRGRFAALGAVSYPPVDEDLPAEVYERQVDEAFRRAGQ